MSVFETDGDQSDQNALEALVGEDKKFKTVEDLAKGKLESDNYIEQLKAQIAERDAQLASAATVDEVLARIQEKQLQPNNPPVVEANQPAKPAITEDILVEKVKAVLAENDQNKLIQHNVEEVTARLIEAYGSEDAANQYVRQRAQELGVSVAFLQEVAAKSPKAFFETVRVEAPKAPPRPTQGDVNPAALKVNTPGLKPNTYAWYQELRRTNPAAYYDQRTQMQMHEDAIKNRDAFYA